MKPARLERIKGGFAVRLRCGAGQHKRFRIALLDEGAAQVRANRMSALARALVAAGKASEAPILLEEAGAQPDEAGMSAVESYAAELCTAPPAPPSAPEKVSNVPRGRKPTFAELGQQWTSGRLHALYPDQVPLKATAVDDASRLDRYAYPVFGHKPIDEVTLDDCEAAMRAIPESSKRSRRHIAGTIARVFAMAVYPCRHIKASPLPKGFLPRALSRKALNYLYPKNDAALLACTTVAFGYRLLWGFLAREGMREGEALGLTWDCVDLEHGMVRLDENKTDDPRAWALDPAVARALRLYREHIATDATPTGPVFLQRSKYGLAETFRLHLEAAGVRKERPELFVSSDARQRIRVHDLRATFITISLANGRSETWVMARTGHRSSMMVNRYRRIATSFSELNLGELLPLDQALPELAALAPRPSAPDGVCNDLCNSEDNVLKIQASPTGFESAVEQAPADSREENAPDASANTSESASVTPPSAPGVQLDAVERALADAIAGATAAGQWSVVAQLAAELQSRRESRQASNVVSLTEARAKRNGGAS